MVYAIAPVSLMPLPVFEHRLLAACLQGDAFRMLQARLQPVPIMALLSIREQPGGSGLAHSLSAAALGQSPASPAGSPTGSGSFSADAAAAADQPASPTSRQRQLIQQQRPRLIEEKRLVQLFKARTAHLT